MEFPPSWGKASAVAVALAAAACSPSDAAVSLFWTGTFALSEGGGGAGGEPASSSSGSDGAGGSAGGSGGAGGEAGSGGQGGSPCAPEPGACGEATCGSATDSCGAEVPCGTCDGSARCVDGVCCTPAACEPGMCGPQDDGCGGEIACDTVCGDGTWMTCGETGRCECTRANEMPFGQYAERDCELAGMGHAYACGEDVEDAPAECVQRSITIGATGPRLWCCP